jgi:hypothetical protein
MPQDISVGGKVMNPEGDALKVVDGEASYIITAKAARPLGP